MMYYNGDHWVNAVGKGSMVLRQFVKGSEFTMATFLSVARGVRHCRKERTRFRIYRKISRFQQRFQISADSAKDFKISAKISDFSEDFKISAKISGFQDFSEDFRFRENFCRDFKISRDFW